MMEKKRGSVKISAGLRKYREQVDKAAAALVVEVQKLLPKNTLSQRMALKTAAALVLAQEKKKEEKDEA